MKRAPAGSITLNRPGTLFRLRNMFSGPEKRVRGVFFVVNFQILYLIHF